MHIGFYIYIEANDLAPGDRARLRSGYFGTNWYFSANCLTFNYSVHGRHIGRLELYDQLNVLRFLHVGCELLIRSCKYHYYISHEWYCFSSRSCSE